jgi:hypothetical protein
MQKVIIDDDDDDDEDNTLDGSSATASDADPGNDFVCLSKDFFSYTF